MSISGSVSNVPVSVYVHIATTAINFFMFLSRVIHAGTPQAVLILILWSTLILLLYLRFIRDRKNWARWILALLTLPPGLLLFMKASNEYVQTYEPSLVRESS